MGLQNKNWYEFQTCAELAIYFPCIRWRVSGWKSGKPYALMYNLGRASIVLKIDF